MKYYCIIEKDVALLKLNNKSSFKDMYKYCVETTILERHGYKC